MAWNPNVLKHLSDVLKEMFPEPEIILDGELYKHGWNLQRINGAVQIARKEPREDTHEIEYHIFDRVSYQLPFKDRWKLVFDRSELFRGSNIKLVTTYPTERLIGEEEFYAWCVGSGYEGMMYRLGDCPYTRPKDLFIRGTWNVPHHKFLSDKNNRCWHLLKRKDWQDGEFLCVAVEEGEGKRAGKVGRFICKVNRDEEKTFGVGSGITDAEAQHYFENPEQVIGHFIKVKFLTFTSDGKPFNPTIEAIL